VAGLIDWAPTPEAASSAAVAARLDLIIGFSPLGGVTGQAGQRVKIFPMQG
jgi:hypothetical protein